MFGRAHRRKPASFNHVPQGKSRTQLKPQATGGCEHSIPSSEADAKEDLLPCNALPHTGDLYPARLYACPAPA